MTYVSADISLWQQVMFSQKKCDWVNSKVAITTQCTPWPAKLWKSEWLSQSGKEEAWIQEVLNSLTDLTGFSPKSN